MTTPDPVQVSWLEGVPARMHGGQWGIPWPMGRLRDAGRIGMRDERGHRVVVDSWVTARWPDGSIKWTGHAIGAQNEPQPRYRMNVDHDDADAPMDVVESADSITVDTGAVRCEIRRSGSDLISALWTDGRIVAEHGRLVSLLQSDPDSEQISRTSFTSSVRSAGVESRGCARTVVKIEGTHSDGEREWLPFIVRLYFHSGSNAVRAVHTLIWDGDEQRDFLAGLGLRFEVPMRDQLHDRHIRIAGADGGFLTEAVRGLTGLRRDPGEKVRAAQRAGAATPPVESWNPQAGKRLGLIPAWGDYTLTQSSADGFTLRKRTSAGHGWVDISSGTRSAGYSYVGGVSGGLGLSLRDFWQSYPAQLDIRGAAADRAESTLWLYSPAAAPMDLRFYHDGLGQDDHTSQLEGLEITYEDYEPGFGTPYGIARTHELSIFAYPATPPAQTVAADSAAGQLPPLLRAEPEYLHSVGIFGDWNLVDRSTPARADIEDTLDSLFDYYAGQRECRRWYGFWNYGDVMHTYDPDRHTWRYDVGGYAWDNSELSPDLWLWYAFLRSGRAEVFRFAEAMTRHTGEVDVYHLGRFSGLGSRHNVQHWGCSAKQHRISNPAYRRFFYYLTADERVGDLLTELLDSDRTFRKLDPNRKVRTDGYVRRPDAVSVGLGTDWSALAATWLTAWERTGDPVARDKLVGTMRDIGALRYGFLTGDALYDPDIGRFRTGRERIAVSHLSAVFGLAEICSEVIALTAAAGIDTGRFADAWLQYCRLFLAGPQEQEAEVGQALTGISLRQGHSRLTAYAANRLGDPRLAAAAWEAFGTGGWPAGAGRLQAQRIDGPDVLAPVEEIAGCSTNTAAQYALAAIQNLALVPQALEAGKTVVTGR